jgi:hypothetical protein
MKNKIIKVFTMILVSLVFACSVEQPYSLQLESLTAEMSPYSQQGYIKVQADFLTNVKAHWDVSETGAQGVEIVATRVDGFKCNTSEEYLIARTTIFVPSSNLIDESVPGAYMTNNLGEIFRSQLNNFTIGEYAFCIAAIRYGNKSSYSIPAFVTVLQNQHSY